MAEQWENHLEHFSRGWGTDPFAPACGCEVAPCGKVVLAGVRKGCDQHDFMVVARSIRSGHSAARCPSGITGGTE